MFLLHIFSRFHTIGETLHSIQPSGVIFGCRVYTLAPLLATELNFLAMMDGNNSTFLSVA